MATQLRIYPRLMRAVIASLVLAMLLAWGIAVQLLSRSYEQRVIRQTTDAVGVLADGLVLTPSLLQRLARLEGSNFVALDANYVSKLSTFPDTPPAILAAVRSLPNAANARSAAPAVPIRLKLGGIEHIVVARSISYPLDPRLRHIVGVTSLAETREAVRRAALALGLAMLAAIAVLTLVLRRLVRGITTPLEQLAAMAGRIANGERGVSSNIRGRDEIGMLGAALEDMSRRLESYEAEHARRSRSTALGEMAARVAHEIRNPLTGMKMHLQLLAESAEPAQAAGIARVLDELRRLELVVDSTLAVGRDSTLVLVDCDLAQTVAEVAQLMQPALAHRHVQLEQALEPVGTLRLDRDRIKQVLLNLLTNAADALPAGGRVRLSTLIDESGQHCLVAVEDSGPGVDPAIRDRLFEAASTTKPMGLGVGLALSRDLIRQHGGDLRAESARELGGARFVIALPLAPAANTPAAALQVC